MNELTLQLGSWQELGAEAAALRHEVFVLEQQVPAELELDELDAQALHVLARVGGRPVGTARLLLEERPARIGRMAVAAAWRKQGIGSAMLRRLMDAAAEYGARTVLLHAQCHAQAFYAGFGFVPFGGVFDDAGIDHIAMRLELPA